MMYVGMLMIQLCANEIRSAWDRDFSFPASEFPPHFIYNTREVFTSFPTSDDGYTQVKTQILGARILS